MVVVPISMRWLSIAAAVIAASVDALYLGVVQAQGGGDPEFLRVPFVAAFIALMAICAALASRRSSEPIRPLLLGIAAAGLLVIGFFALFSIGLPLMVAGLLLLISLSATLSPAASSGRRRALSSIGAAIGGGALAIAVLLGGFSLTDVMIRCPASGQMSGDGITMLGTGYQYSCDRGKLTVTR